MFVELVLKHPDDAPAEKVDDVVVVVACEDATTAPQVWGLLRRVGREAGGRGRLIYSWWTFSVLASPSLRHLAAREAATADMVVIAARGVTPLPMAVKDWLSGWVSCNEDPTRPRALVVLNSSELANGLGALGFISELRELAEANGVDLFIGECGGGDRLTAPRGAAPFSGNGGCRTMKRGARLAGQGSRMRLAIEGAPG